MTKDQALLLARDARSAEELERAMMALAALPADPDVDAARADLSARFDAATDELTPPLSREGSRLIDATRNPGSDSW